jgi:hypothetical protein
VDDVFPDEVRPRNLRTEFVAVLVFYVRVENVFTCMVFPVLAKYLFSEDYLFLVAEFSCAHIVVLIIALCRQGIGVELSTAASLFTFTSSMAP